jgi:hypothetical protein
MALTAAILALEAKLLPYEIEGLTLLINKIRGHKAPGAAVKAATVAVDTLDDRITDDPSSPYFQES